MFNEKLRTDIDTALTTYMYNGAEILGVSITGLRSYLRDIGRSMPANLMDFENIIEAQGFKIINGAQPIKAAGKLGATCRIFVYK